LIEAAALMDFLNGITNLPSTIVPHYYEAAWHTIIMGINCWEYTVTLKFNIILKMLDVVSKSNIMHLGVCE
jgi:hypothetical protein